MSHQAASPHLPQSHLKSEGILDTEVVRLPAAAELPISFIPTCLPPACSACLMLQKATLLHPSSHLVDSSTPAEQGLINLATQHAKRLAPLPRSLSVHHSVLECAPFASKSELLSDQCCSHLSLLLVVRGSLRGSEPGNSALLVTAVGQSLLLGSACQKTGSVSVSVSEPGS